MVQPPSGTVTFLFTDIEGSTRLWEERPEEMRTLAAEHDDRFREVIERHDGYLVKATGDGFHAAFGRAADAVTAAEEAQASIAGFPEIKVRMGINTGEVQERDGDYFGPPVNRAARLMAAGHGGQVLIAGVTADLVSGLVLRNLGEHRLRDLGAPMTIWQLGEGEFPALRTLDELPGNLPVQRTSFVGRAEEVKELAELVGAERLVTLTGPGGVGKSRLALQVAADVAPVFRDGAWFASLASLEEGALVAATILEAMGVPERRGEPATATLCSWARAREALLVIDNCEHLLASVAGVADQLVEASPAISVLATSQAPLGVRGEHVWPVAPLSGSHAVSRDSVELFVDRAGMARADFVLTDENEPAVVEICERLDHIPLAIELAAARVRGMSPADISRRLDQRLRLLASSDRAAPGRHRTLDAAVRWSYELLDETQQQVFDRLSVFAGPFTIEAAEAVVAEDGVEEWEVLDAILALVDKSLVLADEARGGTRYRLLETMRQFGQANLAAGDVVTAYRVRHVDYYADFVLSRCPQLHGSGDVAAREEVERELENIRVALRHAADDRESARFEDLFAATFTVWLARGRDLEGAGWAAELRERPMLDPRRRIVALGFAAQVLMQVNLALARELAVAAEELAAATDAGPPLIAISASALMALMHGATDSAREGSRRVVEQADEEPDPFLRAQAYVNVMAVLGLCGNFDELAAVSRSLAELATQLDNRYIDSLNTGSLAPVAHLVDPDGAGDTLRRSFALHEEVGNKPANISGAMFLSLHELRGGDRKAAADWARRSLQLAVDYGPSFIAQVTSTAIAVVKRDLPNEAAVLLGALRADRARKQLAGTEAETDAEVRYEASLRRTLGDEFDGLYARGEALGEDEMAVLVFEQLDVVAAAADTG